MNKIVFLFIALFILILPFFGLPHAEESNIASIICFVLISTIGISHGAIDNYLFRANYAISNIRFIVYYVIIVLSYLFVWIVLPNVAMLLFLLLSAYHFGQSQFVQFAEFTSPFLRHLLYLSWGSALLGGLIYFNASEINAFLISDPNFDQMQNSFLLHHIGSLFYTATAISGLLLLSLLLYRHLSGERFVLEVITFALLQFSFYLFPALVGFTLYFIVLHSMKVLQEEYHFLKSTEAISDFFGFLKILFPLTFVSIIGIFFIVALIQFELLEVSVTYALLLLISSLTLPHAFVMKYFYAHNHSSLRII